MQLKDLNFSDIYICANPAPGSVQVLTWYRPSLLAVSRSLTATPSEYEQDIEKLRVVLKEISPKETSIVYDSVHYRLTRISDVHNNWHTLRRVSDLVLTLDDIGVDRKVSQKMIGLGTGGGLILVSGLPGSGKTTVAGACLKAFLDRYAGVGVTLENPPELPLSGPQGHGFCYQIKVNNDSELEAQLENISRYAAHYVLVGEIKTPAVALSVLKAATQGMMVLATLDAASIESALQSLLVMTSQEGAAPALLAEAFQGILQLKPYGKMEILPLFISLDSSDPVRNLIRTNRLDHLENAISQQNNWKPTTKRW